MMTEKECGYRKRYVPSRQMALARYSRMRPYCRPGEERFSHTYRSSKAYESNEFVIELLLCGKVSITVF